MSNYFYIIEKCPDTKMYVGYVPNIKGAHSQAKTLKELHSNMKEVIELVKNDNDSLEYKMEFVKVEKVLV